MAPLVTPSVRLIAHTVILVLLFHDPATAPSRNVSGEICLPISLLSESVPSEHRFKFERTTRGLGRGVRPPPSSGRGRRQDEMRIRPLTSQGAQV